MEIRKLAQHEKEAAMQLVWAVFLAFEAPDYAEEGIKTFRDFIDDADEIGRLEIYGAFEKEAVVGVIASRNEGSHLALFFVKRELHRQGIGRKLFETLLKNSRAEIITVNASPYAAKIYRRLGFTDTDKEQTKNGIRYIPMQYKRQ